MLLGYNVIVRMLPGDGHRGDGHLPLFPDIGTDGSVLMSEGEVVLERWQSTATTDVGKPSAQTFEGIDVTITSHRVLFADSPSRLREFGAVGHVPLEALGKFGVGVAAGVTRAEVIELNTVGRFDGKMRRFVVTVDLPRGEATRLFDTLVRASKARWAAYDLPEAVQNAIRRARPVAGVTKRTIISGRMKTLDHVQPLALLLNDVHAVPIDDRLHSILRVPIDVATLDRRDGS